MTDATGPDQDHPGPAADRPEETGPAPASPDAHSAVTSSTALASAGSAVASTTGAGTTSTATAGTGSTAASTTGAGGTGAGTTGPGTTGPGSAVAGNTGTGGTGAGSAATSSTGAGTTGAGSGESEPDARFTFANERTFLAWSRTALALVVAGLGIVQLLPPFPHVPWGRHLIGVPLILLGAVVASAGYTEWLLNQRALRRGVPVPRSVLPVILTVTITSIALVSAIVLLLSALQS